PPQPIGVASGLDRTGDRSLQARHDSLVLRRDPATTTLKDAPGGAVGRSHGQLRRAGDVRYSRGMISILCALMTLAWAAISEKPALVVEGAQAPARIARATLIPPAEAQPVG